MRTSPITLRETAGSFVRLSTWLLASVLVLVALMWPQMASAQTVSPRCPTPFTLSVANGGSGTINASACQEGFGLGLTHYQEPANGSFVIDTLASTVTYTHNGSATASDTFRFDDGSGFYVQVNVTVGPASSITIAPVSLSAMTAGTPFSQTLTASGGTGPYTYAVTGGTLPAGLTLSTGGVLSGTPTQRGSFSFAVTATDSTAASGSKSYTPTVAGGTLSITPNPPPNATISIPYSTTFTPAGGVAPMSLIWEPNPSFPLPPGLSMVGNTLSGTPTATGTYTFGIRVTDSSTGPGSWFQVVNVTMTVAAAPTIVVNPSTVPGATAAAAYSQTMTASGGTAPYSFAISAGALPPGLTLAASGALSGTPTAVGTFNFTVRATDANSFTGTRAYSLVSAPPTISIAPTSVPNGTTGVAYSQSLTPSGGNAPYNFTVNAGALPPGLTLAANGTVSGTPTVSGTFNFSASATDSTTGTGAPYSGARAYSLVIAAPTISVSPTTLPNGAVATAYSQTITASGGGAPYTFAVTAGALPAGLALASNGTLSGTPTAGGTFNFTITATDNFGSTGSRAYSVTVGAPTLSIAPTSLPDPTVGAAYSQAVTASGGTASYSYAVTAGTLPSGLTLSSGGVVTGTPIAGGTFNFTITATDSSTGTGPYTGSRAYSITVAAPTVSLSPASLPDGTIASAYSQSISASGGIAPYGYAVTAGSVPSGLSLSAGGTLSGTPTAVGTFNFTVTATDSATGTGPYTGSQAYSVTIADIAPIANPVSATVAYDSASNPITLNITGGAPNSVAIATAALHGTATASGTSITYTPGAGYAGADSFTYTATNSAGTSAPATVSITVGAPTLSVSPTGPLGGQVGTAFSQTFSFSGGAAPYGSVAVTGIPAGLSITATGPDSVTVSGTPTASGAFTLGISASDSSTGDGPFSVNQSVSLNVLAPALSLPPSGGPMPANVGVPFSQSFTATGGTAPFSYAITAGTLPTGLSLNAGTGMLSGTPTAPGTFNFTITATDSSTGAGAPFSISRAYSVAVAAAIVFSPATLPDAAAGFAYNQAITASGVVPPVTFSVVGGALPAGINLTSAGVLAGTSITPGTFNFTVRVRDAGGTTADQAYTLVVVAPTIVVAPTTLVDGVASSAYSQAITASGGVGPYDFSLVAGALPAGLSLGSAGLLDGTPSVAGVFNFTVRATDANGFTGDQAYSLTIAAPTIVLAPTTLIDGLAGSAYSQPITASGGAAPYGFTVVAGTLPTGMNLGSTGELDGTPTVAGVFNFTVRATDANGFTGDQAYALTVAAPTIVVSPATLPDGIGGTAYSQTLTVAGGATPHTWSLTAGVLPPGLALSSAGVLSGTPTTSGTFNFTVTAADANGFSGSQAYSLVIAAPTITLSPTSMASGVAGVAYSQSITASGGTASYNFSLLIGSLPVGVSLGSAGVLSGTPTVAGTFNFTVRATDAFGFTGDQAYTLIVDAPTLVVSPATLPDGSLGVAYGQAITASGGAGPYSYGLQAGALPAGITLNSGGLLSGTPMAGGTFNFTVRASDANGFTADQPYSLTIVVPTIVLSPATLPGGTGSAAYNQTITASGGAAPYGFTVLSGALPSGLSLSSAGVISGTPWAAGSFTFVVRATDAHGATGEQSYTVAIAVPVITITPATLPDGGFGETYSQTLTASGGLAPYAFSYDAGTLPPGIGVRVDGTVTGTFLQDGTFTFTARVEDANGFVGHQQYTITVAPPALAITPATLPDAMGGTAYSQTLTGSGGTAPYDFMVVSGSLPRGLSLGGTGEITGVPREAGSFSFSVRLLDSHAFTLVQAFTLNVVAPTITITPASLPDGDAGVPYAQALSASGGTAPYTFSVVGGALPAGLSLDGSGTISGTPAASGTFNFIVRASDAVGFTGDQAYALVVTAPTIAVSPATLPDGEVGTAYSQAILAAGGTAPYAFAVSAGSLPAGLTLDAAGTLSGTPTASGSFSFDVTATDSLGFTGTASYIVAIVDAAPIAADDSASTDAGVAVSIPVATNDSGVISTLTIATAASSGSVVISGLSVTYTPSPGFFGTDSFTYVANGPGGTSNVATVTITVRALPVPVGVPQTLTTLAGQAVSFDAAAGATGSPTSLTLVSAPLVGTVDVSGTTITYTPPADAEGPIAIGYTLNNTFGASAPITSTVNVNPLPMAVAHEANTVVGVAVQVVLTEGATGGPFTAADVISVSPAAAGTTQVTAGGTPSAPTYTLTFTPAAGFAGTAVVSYTLDNAFATSTPAAVTILVTERPDPTQDAEVTGLLGAQTTATKRFALGQIDNFQSRMERLHDGGGNGFSNGLTVAITSRCHDGRTQRPGEACADEPLALPGANAAAPGPEAPVAGRSNAPFGVWTAGGMSFGDYDQLGGNGFEFETSAVSAGMDYRFSSAFVLGGGLGYGRDVTDVGENGTRSEATARSFALYGSHRMSEKWFVDMLLGYQDLSFDARRHVTATGGTVDGERDGDQWFGSLVSTYEHREEAYTLAPYLRVDVARATLDAFTEQGDPVYALHYGEQDVNTTTGNLGVRMEFHNDLGWGVLSPMFRVEYQYDFEDPGVATLNYADLLGGPVYRTRLQGLDTSRLLLGLGAVLQTEHDWLLKAEFRGLFGNAQDEHSILIHVEKEF